MTIPWWNDENIYGNVGKVQYCGKNSSDQTYFNKNLSYQTYFDITLYLISSTQVSYQ